MSEKNLKILKIGQRDIAGFIPKIPVVASRNFNCIEIGPLQLLKENNVGLWWLPYQPCSLDAGNIYGYKDQIKLFCDKCREYGIHPILDVVLNHMAGDFDSLNPHHNVDDKLKNKSNIWKPKKEITDWKNRYEVTHYCMHGLPGLNVWDKEYQQMVIKFLNDCMDLGIEGFRFDSAKNIAVPEEYDELKEYALKNNLPKEKVCDFWPSILESLNKRNAISYCELIYVGDHLIDMYSKHMKVLTTSDYDYKDKVIKFPESQDSYLDGMIGYSRDWTIEKVNQEARRIASEYPNTQYYARRKVNFVTYDNGISAGRVIDNETWNSDEVEEINKIVPAKQKIIKR